VTDKELKNLKNTDPDQDYPPAASFFIHLLKEEAVGPNSLTPTDHRLTQEKVAVLQYHELTK